VVGARRRAEPDWALLVRELRRPGVNMTVLWEEHGREVEDGYGNPTLADAILDRVLHNAYRLELSGESLRKRPAPTLDA
jgi:transposase